MAISIPIISEFVGDGIEKAKKEFSQLETAGEKAQFAIKKAAVPAAAALAGIGALLVDATKGAMEDAAAQAMLAKQLKNSAGATDVMVSQVEKSISAMSMQLGIADDELRPAFSNLVRSTKDVTRAQELMAAAADIAAQTGKPLETVTIALAKAEQGQYAALKKLGIPMGDNIRALMDQASESKKVAKAQAEYDALVAGGATAKEQAKALDKLKEAQAGLSAVTVEGADYVKDLAASFGGAAEAAANTAQGGMKRLTIGISETKESIGAALLPVLEAVLPYVNGLATWAQQNPGVFLAVAGAIAAIATAILAINFAMAANPITLIAIGIGALIAALGVAYTKFEAVRTVVDGVFGAIKWWINNVTIPAFKLLFDVVKTIFNGIAMVWNNTFGKIKFSVPSWVPGIGGKGFDVPDIPMLANGGIVDSPTLALIGESGAEAVVPLDRMGQMGNNVTINVNGGDPQAVVNALRRYMQVNGSVPIRVSN